ncbi:MULTISPECIES: HlyD family type I secretion periplasmic adaptor subunit [unclassified Bradyrhizobium]|uniref:HlyD family type I secretion periplasmic adaptor subunit n=1 Tax=unclassified Bradyrhizobium TaxID=2631580 RepID=UPI00247B2154|nr:MULTISPECIES: HlyD family type I secretion periplasmic adaptor subunit [unclassified Bradyrhizobium]WGR68377.1 HlyD family type I secretion periplasmic adaptor subunit [Bradyrhizobium sp. ISRA426]WGR80432.1 HlyD family type I secretion periplasmic adaptor subunit [Bradyrhizobium sp. ISRA430]WGR83617.1 HlyD family type I secretion periplasmic adaptor subunit [Bradyrhizobium sp. ISRA432]
MSTLGATYVTSRERAFYARPGRPALVGAIVVGAFTSAMTLWGTLAPISGAAIASGNLQVEGRRQSVQHPYGGVIRQLLVRDGAHVEKGQLLVALDDSDPRAKLEVLVADRDAARAAEARLIAERDGRTAPDFGVDAQGAKPALRQAMANEIAMMAARRHQFEAETAVLKGKIAELNAQIGGTQAQLTGTEKQRELLSDEMGGAQRLYEQGYTPKTRILALQREDAKLQADIGAQRATIAGMQQQISQNELEIAKAERARMSEITDQLRSTENKLAELAPKIEAATDVVTRTEIRAPATGSVVGLDVFTEGGVIQPGAKLMDIVPSDNPLIVDAQLKLSDINDVTVGRRAEVRLTGVNYIERPRLYGIVRTVSADRVTNDKSGPGYYAVEVSLEPEDVKKSRIELQSGMPAEVIVPTRPRTLFEYLFGPLRDELTRAFRER